MNMSFGAELRNQRERQRVTLAAIANETKINIALLEGLERDDVSRWPGGVFRRAYIRAYAQAIGLDPERVAREFLERYPDVLDEQGSVDAVAQAGGRKRTPTRMELALASLANWARARKALTPSSFDGGECHSDVAERDAHANRTMEPSRPASEPPPGTKPVSSPIADMSPAPMPVIEREASAVVPFPLPAFANHGDSPDRSTAARMQVHVTSTSADAVHRFTGQRSDSNVHSAAAGRRRSPSACAEPNNQTSGGAGTAAAEHDPRSPLPRRRRRRRGASARTNRQERNDTDAIGSVAHLCTRLACARSETQIGDILRDLARAVDAVGVVLWMCEPMQRNLYPVLAHGYAERVIARLPRVHHDADNVVAAAFRSAQTQVIERDSEVTGAVAAPLLTSAGCLGVLALEFCNAGEQRADVQSAATILGAQLSTLLAITPVARVANA